MPVKLQFSAWGLPAFVIPKRNNQIRFIVDFRQLNKSLVRKPYPLPSIQEQLEPISKMSGKKAKFVWGREQQSAFKEIKKMVAEDVMLAFPDFKKPVVVHTDTSEYQLGAIISQ